MANEVKYVNRLRPPQKKEVKKNMIVVKQNAIKLTIMFPYICFNRYIYTKIFGIPAEQLSMCLQIPNGEGNIIRWQAKKSNT